MLTKHPRTRTTGRQLTTAPLALFMTSALIWSLAGGSTTVGQQASSSTASQKAESQSAAAKSASVERDATATPDPAAVESKASRRSKATASPLRTAKNPEVHAVHVRKLLDQWFADGIVRATDESGAEPSPELSLSLNDAWFEAGERATAALLELSELRIPELSVSFPMSPRVDRKTPEPTARLHLSARTPWEPAR